MLKKSIAMLLTLSLCFSLASVAFAAEPDADTTEPREVTLVISDAYTVNEAGVPIIEPVSLDPTYPIQPMTMYKPAAKSQFWEADDAIGILFQVNFEYQPGEYVRCASRDTSIIRNLHEWRYVQTTYKETENALGTVLSVTSTVEMATTAGVKKTYSLTIRCDMRGSVTYHLTPDLDDI